MNYENYSLIAHRGIYNNDNIPENSIPAFKQAIKENVAIEFDVHLTKDNEIVVYHDYNLKRLTGHDALIKDCTLEQLTKFKLLNTSYKIPTLDEVFNLIYGKVPILIEIKNEGLPGNLEKLLIKKLKDYKGYYLIESFDPLSLAYFKNKATDIPRGQLITNNKSSIKNPLLRFLLKNMFFNFISKPSFIAYEIETLNNNIVNKCKKHSKKIFAYTINNKETLNKSIKLQCDGIIFDKLNPQDIKKYSNL